MGTAVVIQIVAAPERHALAADAAARAFLEVERLEALLSSYRAESDVSRINAAAGDSLVLVAPETWALVQKSIELGEATSGAFDITFGPLGGAWDFRRAAPPSQPTIAAARSLVDYRRLELAGRPPRVGLPERGMRIGLGGIAKGYIVDRAAAVLQAAGFDNCMIDAGGDLCARGAGPSGGGWRVGVRDPRDPERVLVTLTARNAAVVTSGDYQRYFFYEGRRYHHIIDPATGYPAPHCRSVTVVAPDTGIADALATGIFVMGPAAGVTLAERLPEVEALVIDAEGTHHATSGLRQASGPAAD